MSTPDTCSHGERVHCASRETCGSLIVSEPIPDLPGTIMSIIVPCRGSDLWPLASQSNRVSLNPSKQRSARCSGPDNRVACGTLVISPGRFTCMQAAVDMDCFQPLSYLINPVDRRLSRSPQTRWFRRESTGSSANGTQLFRSRTSSVSPNERSRYADQKCWLSFFRIHCATTFLLLSKLCSPGRPLEYDRPPSFG